MNHNIGSDLLIDTILDMNGVDERLLLRCIYRYRRRINQCTKGNCKEITNGENHLCIRHAEGHRKAVAKAQKKNT
jgi:hypothetical protein